MADDRLNHIDEQQLEKALARLRPAERELLLLRARDGLSNAEAGARLGISADTAERRLADALVNLGRALERLDRPWGRLW
ncbi:MAG: sigma-70 family RNA polymerase sigma factor [Sphingomonas sp.]|nr:sigma-70 family RNA polymerase sigma factor [Sphingomonas sp.]